MAIEVLEGGFGEVNHQRGALYYQLVAGF